MATPQTCSTKLQDKQDKENSTATKTGEVIVHFTDAENMQLNKYFCQTH